MNSKPNPSTYGIEDFKSDRIININNHFSSKLVGIDIEKEYALIQQKKCLHPVMVRNLICVEYNNIQLRKAIDADERAKKQLIIDKQTAEQMAAMNGGEIDD